MECPFQRSIRLTLRITMSAGSVERPPKRVSGPRRAGCDCHRRMDHRRRDARLQQGCALRRPRAVADDEVGPRPSRPAFDERAGLMRNRAASTPRQAPAPRDRGEECVRPRRVADDRVRPRLVEQAAEPRTRPDDGRGRLSRKSPSGRTSAPSCRSSSLRRPIRARRPNRPAPSPRKCLHLGRQRPLPRHRHEHLLDAAQTAGRSRRARRA